MVIVEVEAAVLRGGESGHAGEEADIFTGFFTMGERGSANGVEHLGDGTQIVAEGFGASVSDAVRMIRSEVGLERADVVGQFSGVLLGISLRAGVFVANENVRFC